MSHTNYHVVNNAKEMQLEVTLEGQKAYLGYRFYKNDIAFMHTFVPDTLEGRGIAGALAVEAFRYAEEHMMPVRVYCPFVAGFLKKHPEYLKLLHPDYSAKGSDK